MTKRTWIRIVIPAIIAVLLMYSSGCTYKERMKTYYSNTENFITATGVVSYLNYTEDNQIYIGISNTSPEFEDCSFKVVGKNAEIALENGISEKFEIGDEIIFMSAPEYFGDGYVMPIVEIIVNDVKILNFKEGYVNFLETL